MADKLDTGHKCLGNIVDSHQKTAKCSLCNEKNTGILKECKTCWYKGCAKCIAKDGGIIEHLQPVRLSQRQTGDTLAAPTGPVLAGSSQMAQAGSMPSLPANDPAGPPAIPSTATPRSAASVLPTASPRSEKRTRTARKEDNKKTMTESSRKGKEKDPSLSDSSVDMSGDSPDRAPLTKRAKKHQSAAAAPKRTTRSFAPAKTGATVLDPFQQQTDPTLPPPGRVAFSGVNAKSYDSSGAIFAKEAFAAPRRTPREPAKRTLAKLDPVPAHLKGKTTVIIGGGVMGLCIAYHLAASSQGEVKPSGRKPGIKHTIIIIEESEQPFHAGSGTNSGRLSTAQLSEDLKQLGEFSYEQWEELGSKLEFREQTAYCGGSLLHLKCISGRNSGGFDLAPEWLKLFKEDLVSHDPPDRRGASVDPVKLGTWLVNQCYDRGVWLRIGTRIIAANHSADCNLESVTVEVVKVGQECVIPCDNLVIAAGTWSETLFNRLFPDSSVALPSSKIRAADWMLVANPEPMSQGNVSIGDVSSVGLELASRTDGQIWVAAVADGAIRQPQPTQLYSLYPQTFGRLRRHAADLIAFPRGAATNPEPLAKGTALTATMMDGNPVMGRVGFDRLWVAPRSKGTKANPLGVFLCYGHGVGGLTLGMGCGKIMADMIRNVQPAIDVSKFDIRLASQAGGVASGSGHTDSQSTKSFHYSRSMSFETNPTNQVNNYLPYLEQDKLFIHKADQVPRSNAQLP
ncbi:hypothetical protein LTR60_000978 [Cryomyces antarcticus]|nr:hypothetical protein LTR60_000978 [Cryomyces antarcticus]